jgi:antitoxin (DNA-binding transcriptional repressor) of toxin-antitoxin stability system
MRQVGAFEAKNTLGTLLDLVEEGEEIVITRHGKPVARMIRETLQSDPQPALDALQRIRGRALANSGSRFEWDEWKQFRDEGRR